MLKAVVPKHDDCPPGYLPAAIKYQLHNSVEVSFAGSNMPGINVIGLEPGEEQLTWCNIIAR